MKYLIFTMSETSDEMISMIAVRQSCPKGKIESFNPLASGFVC